MNEFECMPQQCLYKGDPSVNPPNLMLRKILENRFEKNIEKGNKMR